jgi:beta-glucosidase
MENELGGTMDDRNCPAPRNFMRRGFQLVCLLAAVLLAGMQALRSGSPAESDIDRRVDAILAKMSLEEKIDYLGGTDGFFVRALPELGVPRLRMADGPIGARNFGPATAMAAGINLAAT